MKFIRLFSTALLTGCSLLTSAQTATGICTTLQQPCNGNGILAVHITGGLTAPVHYNYLTIDYALLTTHTVSSMYDTLTGISTAVAYVNAYDNFGNSFFSATGMNPPFVIDPPTITDAICPSLTGTMQVTINSGTAPASVDWYQDLGSGSTPGLYEGSGNPIILPAGTYAALITDASGCTIFTGVDSMTYFQINNISGINFSVTTTDASCTNGTAAVSGLSGGIAPYSYLWSNGASSASITGLSQGYYTATVTDAQGCYTSNASYVYQPLYIAVNPVVTAATCLQNDGSVISFGSNGTPPYTYVYSNGFAGQTAAGLSGNTSITVTATDANGCTGTGYIYINSSTPIVVTYSSVNSSCTAPTGSATLSVSGGTSPYTINWGTSPAMTGTSITGMPPGNYPFTVTDAAGCVQNGIAVISPVSVLNALVNMTDPVCPSTSGAITLVPSGTSPPFTYMWNTGATTPTVTGLSAGYYTCTITDNAGCTLLKYVPLNLQSPISIGMNTTPASCLYTADGSVTATVSGGTAPYVYSWSNGQTSATASGLMSGVYDVTVQDANGCTQNTYGVHTYVGYDALNTSCYCTISGKVYKDVNSNCIMDAGETGIEHIMIHCSGYGYTFTDANGDYSFLVPTGSYTLSESVQYQYPLASCQSNSIPVSVTATSGCTNTVNFANNVNTIHDIHIIRTRLNNPTPGNNYEQALIVQNDGTVNENTIQLADRDDGQLNFTSSSPTAYTQLSPVTEPTWYSITSGFPALAPGQSLSLYSTYYVPTYVPLATVVHFSDTASYAAPMSNWLTDFTPWNNINNFSSVVMGSYDPNFKEVSPKGSGAPGYITTADSSLDYVVHFQNTGSFYAEKVVVMDTLDADLDWTTLRTGYADHPYTATVSESGVLTFTFNAIHLPWQSQNEMGSRGMVSYTIKQKPHLTVGTEIRNSAAIYFDYNAPVITNQTLNTIQLPSGINDEAANDDVTIYPNPANEVLNINLGEGHNAVTISIYDLQGRVVKKEDLNKGSNLFHLNVSGLVNGIYFVEISESNGQHVVKKFIRN